MLTKRGDTWVADLREYGGKRQSLYTKDKDEARWLHNELEQMVLARRTIDGDTVRALKAARRATAAGVPEACRTATVAAVQESGRKTVTLREAFALTSQCRDEWRDARDFKAIERKYRAVTAHFGAARMLHTITALDMDDFKQAQIKAGIAPGTYNNRVSFIDILFTEMAKRHIITKDPQYAVGRPELMERRAGGSRARKHIYSLKEEQQIVQWFQSSTFPRTHEMADLTTALIYTGLRLGEMLALHRDDVNFESGYITVRRSGRSSLTTKTEAGYMRSVWMFPRAYEIMDRRIREQRMDFPFGEVKRPHHPWGVMREALGKKDVPDFVIHATRHTCATRLAALKLSPVQLTAWMGWSNISMANTYVKIANVALSDIQEMREALNCAKAKNPELVLL